jgi:hypothetical protein
MKEIDFATAKSIAKAYVGDWILMDEQTIEKHYGWCFHALPQESINTGRCTVAGGPGCCLVERESGRLIPFGSAHSSENWLKLYEQGYFDRYNLKILQVNDLVTTIELLLKLQMDHDTPELENGVEWRIWRGYTAELLQELLSNLPCTFDNHSFFGHDAIFSQIDQSRCCEYALDKREYEYSEGE